MQNLNRLCALIITALLFACAIEDPSVTELDLQRIRLSGDAPFEAYFEDPEPYTYADRQASFFYALGNGDTMKISICEFETATLAKAFFYSSDKIEEKTELLMGNDRRRFLRHGRRLFIFSYMFSISENSAILDSLIQFTKRFPAADTSASAGFHKFSLKNSRADEDVSVQRDYFLGVPTTFSMLVRRYRNANFNWTCSYSAGKVPEKDWMDYVTQWQHNVYGPDSSALVTRLSNGTVIAVYGDLSKDRMREVFKECAGFVK